MRSLFWVVDKETRYEFDCINVCAWLENLDPGYWTNKRKAELGVVRIQGFYLFFGGRAEYFDYFYNLVGAALTRKYRHCKHKLGYNAANGPQIDRAIVLRVSEY